MDVHDNQIRRQVVYSLRKFSLAVPREVIRDTAAYDKVKFTESPLRNRPDILQYEGQIIQIEDLLGEPRFLKIGPAPLYADHARPAQREFQCKVPVRACQVQNPSL